MSDIKLLHVGLNKTTTIAIAVGILVQVYPVLGLWSEDGA